MIKQESLFPDILIDNQIEEKSVTTVDKSVTNGEKL